MKKAKHSDIMGPLSNEELNHYITRLLIGARMSNRAVGEPPVPFEERILKELLHYRSRKQIVVTMDEQHSSMGTALVARFKDPTGADRAVFTSFPMRELGFEVSRGQRFLITVDQMAPDKKMKPRKNPFLIKPKPKKGGKTFFLNEQHTTHVTKAQARKEREAARKAKK